MNIDLGHMRHSGRILSETLSFIENSFISPGLSTLDISKKAEEIIRSFDGASPAFLGYNGFPAAACVSVNQQAVHGVPREETILKEGDIVSVDCGVIFRGHFSDACRTVAIGKVSSRLSKLINITKQSLDKGITAVLVGNRISDISYAVQKHVERNRFNVSRHLGGHGIGRVLHGSPWIPNYGPPGRGPVITSGSCFAIEPVVFDGSVDVELEDDKWTVSSKKGVMSAHFEDTVLVTDKGPEILTR